MNLQPTLFDSERRTMRDAIDLTRQSLLAYQESVIQQDLIKPKWDLAKAAGYQREQEQANFEYYQGQVKIYRELEKERKAGEGRGRDIQTGRDERQDAKTARGIDQAEARGKITGKEADEQRAQLAERQQARALREADRLRDGAALLGGKGDGAGAAQARKAEIEKRKEADALGFRSQDLRDPLHQRNSSIADNLQRVAGGGGVYAAVGKNPLEAKADRTNTLLEKVEGRLSRMEEKRGGSTFQ